MMLLVSWVDSRVSDLYQISTEDVPLPCEIKSIGWLVKRHDDYIVLAREKIDDNWRGVITIPVQCIKEQIILSKSFWV